MSTEHYDVIIIGTGAGGGTLAHRLAPSGKRILLLERGDWLPREPQNWLADEDRDRKHRSEDRTKPATRTGAGLPLFSTSAVEKR